MRKPGKVKPSLYLVDSLPKFEKETNNSLDFSNSSLIASTALYATLATMFYTQILGGGWLLVFCVLSLIGFLLLLVGIFYEVSTEDKMSIVNPLGYSLSIPLLGAPLIIERSIWTMKEYRANKSPLVNNYLVNEARKRPSMDPFADPFDDHDECRYTMRRVTILDKFVATLNRAHNLPNTHHKKELFKTIKNIENQYTKLYRVEANHDKPHDTSNEYLKQSNEQIRKTIVIIQGINKEINDNAFSRELSQALNQEPTTPASDDETLNMTLETLANQNEITRRLNTLVTNAKEIENYTPDSRLIANRAQDLLEEYEEKTKNELFKDAINPIVDKQIKELEKQLKTEQEKAIDLASESIKTHWVNINADKSSLNLP